MEETSIDALLSKAGIRPTSNRILVLRTLIGNNSPMSMSDIETRLDTLDKSSVFRVLTLLQSHGLIHAVEDGRGIVRYEPCNVRDTDSDNDLHAHFYCERCHKVYCFENIPTPVVELPDGFSVRTINYMLKGICPTCEKAL